MSKQNTVDVNGTVTETLPNTMFRVELDNGVNVLCTLAGKLRMNYIKIMTGDKVKVEMSMYDMTKGRIAYRYK